MFKNKRLSRRGGSGPDGSDRRAGFVAVALAGLLVCLALPGWAATMEEIEFSSLPGDRIEIRMQFDEAPPAAAGYTIEQPARIALDLVGVSSALDSKYHSLGTGNARSVTVVEAGDRTRVVVSLQELMPYTTRIDGRTMYMLVGRAEAAARGALSSTEDTRYETVAPTSAADQPMPDVPSVVDVDFRRGELDEGRVIIQLSSPGTGVDVSTEAGRIRVEFTDTVLPAALRRRLDVTDFATPVLSVDALAEGNSTVILVEPTGDYDYLAYQADSVFTLEVKPLTPEELEATRVSRFLFTGEKLSLNFQDIEIRSVLQLIADFTDLNLVASDTVAGNITLRLKNVPWDQALDIIMRTRGLDKRLVGNVLMVAPAAEISAREKLQLESRQQISELAPLRTEFIEVKYADAGEIFKLFEGADGAAGVLSGRGSVIVDERTNSIILTETAEKINQFRSVLERLDVPLRQVLIEARIVKAETTIEEDLGIRWGVSGFGQYDQGGVGTQVGGNLTTIGEIRQGLAGGATTMGGIDVSRNLVIDLPTKTGSGFAFGFVSDKYLLDMELQALASRGLTEDIFRPKVITSDKQRASISQGSQIPFQQATSSGATAVQFQSATLSLDVTPLITPDGRILMELTVNNDSPGAINATTGAQAISTETVETALLVNDGETVVLGGIYTSNERDSSAGTPFLSSLPVVGRLFKVQSSAVTKKELLIFITPRILKDSLTSP